MTQAQLKSFQQALGEFQEVEKIEIKADPKLVYLLVWRISKGKRFRLDFVFVIYDNTLLARTEIDGFLRSYVLNALEKALKE